MAGIELNGKSAVVIGGTSGIGQAIAIGLAEAGADVAATSRRADEVAATARRIEDAGRRTFRVTSDVTERASLERFSAIAVEEFGKVDILVNSAGRTKREPTLHCSESEWDAILNTNLTGTLRASQIFGRHMIERRYGCIINIASLATFVGLFEVTAYCASKAGVGAITKCLAIEWAQYGIRVNAIAPGVIRTSLNEQMIVGTPRGQEFLARTPMKRFGSPQDLVGAAIFLASDSASYVNGEILRVDGGMLASGVNQ